MIARIFQNNPVLSGTLKIFGSMMLLLPSGLLTAAVLSRLLGPEDYGAFTISVAIVLWFQQVSTRPFGRTTIKFIAGVDDWHGRASAILKMQLAHSIFLMTLLVLSAPLWEQLLGRENLTLYLILFAVDVPLYSLAVVHGAFLSGRAEFGKRAQMHATRWIGRMVLVLLFVLVSPTIYAAILGYIGASILEIMVARRYVQVPLVFAARLEGLQFAAYAIPIALTLIGTELYVRLDLLFVEAYSDTATTAGYYAAAQNLTLIPTLFAVALAPTLQSILSKQLKQNEVEAARQLSAQAIRFLLYMIPFAVLVYVTSEPIIIMVYGDAFAPAFPLLQVLIFGAVGVAFCSIFIAIFIAIDRPNWPLGLWLPVIPLAIIGHLLVVPIAGAMGAALVTTSLAWVSALVMMSAILRYWQLHLPILTILRTVIICVLIWQIGLQWQFDGFLLIVQGGVVSLFIIFLYALLQEWPLWTVLNQRRHVQNVS